MNEQEILFRAKAKENGAWVYGYYAKCRGLHYILPKFSENGYDDRADLTPIDPATVGVRSPFKDRTGAAIWQGDRDEAGNEITFDIGSGFAHAGDKPLYIMCSHIKITGNIFDEQKTTP